jgi:predicted nucleic acid-binding Zn ribbon protein
MPTIPCPICAKEMKRKITTPAIVFRGKGFYTTDKGS